LSDLLLTMSLIVLEEWQEIVGTLKTIDVGDKSVSVEFKEGASIEYPIDSNEGQILVDSLEDVTNGTRIGILKTDQIERPLRFRNIESRECEDEVKEKRG